MEIKPELTQTKIRTSGTARLEVNGVPTHVGTNFALPSDRPVMPDLLNTVEEYFGPDNINYQEAIYLADQIALKCRAYYMQFAHFLEKSEKNMVMRRALKRLHETYCRIPHPFVDEGTKEAIKLREDNYERIIIKERRVSPKGARGGKKSV